MQAAEDVLQLDQALAGSLQGAVKELVPTPTIAGPRNYSAASGAARASSFLVLRKEDLRAGAAHDASVKALRAFFR